MDGFLMNDFTKKELEFIYQLLNWITNEDYPLKNKIQSMIDNYCEHEWREGMCEICCKCDAMRGY